MDELYNLTKIKHYFIEQMKELVEEEELLLEYKGEVPPPGVIKDSQAGRILR